MVGSRLLLVLFLFTLGGAGAAFALTDAEYKRFTQESPEFVQAEKRLNQTWKKLKAILPKEEFSRLLEEQRIWIGEGRDKEARAVPDSPSSAAAYSQVTAKRAAALEARVTERSGGRTAGPAGTGGQSAAGKGGGPTGAAQATASPPHAAQNTLPTAGASPAVASAGPASGQAPAQAPAQASGQAAVQASGQAAAQAAPTVSGQADFAAPFPSVSEDPAAGGGGTVPTTPGLTPLPLGPQSGEVRPWDAGPGASASAVGGGSSSHAPSSLNADTGALSPLPPSSVAAGVVSAQGAPSAFPPLAEAEGAAASAAIPAQAPGTAPGAAPEAGGNSPAAVETLADGLYVREGGRISVRKDPRGYFLTISGNDSDGHWTCGVDGIFTLQNGVLTILNEMGETASVRIEVSRDRLLIREHLTEYCGMNGSLAGEYIRK